MAKRANGVGKARKTHSPKTKKRLEVKRAMLTEKKERESKNRNKKRK